MNPIETVILDLLDNSSLPGIYKLLIKNLLSGMARDQQENLLKILFADQKNIEEIRNKKIALYRKYEPMIDSILQDVETGADVSLNPMILNFIKQNEEKAKAEKTDLKLDALKNAIGA